MSSNAAVIELYGLDADEQPTGRIGIELDSVDEDSAWLAGEISHRIRTENGRVFVAVKLVVMPRAASRVLQRLAEAPIAV